MKVKGEIYQLLLEFVLIDVFLNLEVNDDYSRKMRLFGPNKNLKNSAFTLSFCFVVCLFFEFRLVQLRTQAGCMLAL